MSIWEVKDMFNKVKNAVLNLTEMEAKVREATNNDPWGASSTLMNEIAQGTFNYQQFNEIMPFIYRRFREKEPHEWRQIYKSLVLLEYLVKNGAERVIDDCRGRLSLLKSMRSFNYIDDDGKDQGLNVRNRAKELVKLLMDEEMIREERIKAKENRTKYRGMSSSSSTTTMSMSGGGSSSRYQGFGSDSNTTGSRAASGHRNAPSAAGAAAMARAQAGTSVKAASVSASHKQNNTATSGGAKAEAAPAKSNSATATVDLLLLDFSEPTSNAGTKPASAALAGNDDSDDWGGFQSEASTGFGNSTLQTDDDDFTDFQVAPAAAPSSNDADLFGTFDPFASIAPASSSTPTHFTSSVGVAGLGNSFAVKPSSSSILAPSVSAAQSVFATENKETGSGKAQLNDMWASHANLVSLDSLSLSANNTRATSTATGPSLADLAQQQQSSSLLSLGTMTAGSTTATTTNSGNSIRGNGNSSTGWDSLI